MDYRRVKGGIGKNEERRCMRVEVAIFFSIFCLFLKENFALNINLLLILLQFLEIKVKKLRYTNYENF